MSTVERADREILLPSLVAGQRLDQPTFHARYAAMPPETRAELVGGVVYISSPLSYDHGDRANDAGGWLFRYKMFTPGVGSPNNATVKLDADSEPQPDCQLRIPHELGGRSYIDDHGYITGAPELVVEVALSSLDFDLKAKKADYERAGVQEYVVIAVKAKRVYWFIRRGNRFESLPAGPDGIYRSEVFPGLWLDAIAFFGDRRRLIAVLDAGLATPEHGAFVARLTAARQPTET
jgi:Uma2 family endonuclease